MNSRIPFGRGANWRQRFLAIARQAQGVVAAGERAGGSGLRAKAPPQPFRRRVRPPAFAVRLPFQG